MASFNLNGPPQFPNGTSVAAFPVANWNGPVVKTAAPVGSPTETQTVSGGIAAFVALTASTRYTAYALVNSTHTYVDFSTLTDPTTGTTGGTGGGALVVTAAGNKSGTYAPDLGGSARALVDVTATGNLVFAPTNWIEGSEIIVQLTQDATGSRTFSFNDGSGARSVTVDGTAGATTAIHLFGRTVSTLDVEVPGSGATGPQGPTGATGATGPTGPTGPAGGGMTNPMTAANDLIIGGASGAATRLATSASKALVTDGSGNISWGTPASGGAAPRFRKMIGPDPREVQGVSALAAFDIRAIRVVTPEDGTLTALAFYVGNSSGNVLAIVYDTGDNTAGTRHIIGQTASTAVGSGNSWQAISLSSSVAVTAGKSMDFAILVDNATATFGRPSQFSNAGVATLPSGWWPVTGGASPKQVWNRANTDMTPRDVTEANAVGNGTPITIIGLYS